MILFKWLAGFLTGPIVNGILDGYKAKLTAANNTDRIAVDLAKADIEARIEERKVQRDLALASMNHPVWWAAWLLFVVPVGIYHSVIFLVSTFPDLNHVVNRVPPAQEEWARWIVMSIFAVQGATGIAGTIAKRFMR